MILTLLQLDLCALAAILSLLFMRVQLEREWAEVDEDALP